MAREKIFRQSEFEDALMQLNLSIVRIRAKEEFRNHVIKIDKKSRFDLFLNTQFGYEYLTIKTRLKFYRNYRNPPATKFLVIPKGLVGRLFSI